MSTKALHKNYPELIKDRLTHRDYLNFVRLVLLDADEYVFDTFNYVTMNCCEVDDCGHDNERYYRMLCSIMLWKDKPEFNEQTHYWGYPDIKSPIAAIPIQIGIIECRLWKYNENVCRKSLYALDDIL